jgi:isoquinoline 1-oxidoreductase subunit beta
MVAEKSGWAKRKLGKGKGIGIAAHRSFLTYVASVVEVEVFDDGTIKIPRLDTVVDAGLVVNPEAMRAQFEGGSSVRNQRCSQRRDHCQEWSHRAIQLFRLPGRAY